MKAGNCFTRSTFIADLEGVLSVGSLHKHIGVKSRKPACGLDAAGTVLESNVMVEGLVAASDMSAVVLNTDSDISWQGYILA